MTVKETYLHNIINESIKQVLFEKRSIKSKKLYNIIQQHKGILSNRGIFDLNNMTDDDIIDVVDYNQLNDYLNKDYNLGVADEVDYIPLNDGKYIIAKCRGARFDRIGKQFNDNREKQQGDFEELYNKTEKRHKERQGGEDYKWNNKDAEDIFKNPYYREGSGGWTPERKKEVMNNIRSGKRWWEREDESVKKQLNKYIKESVKQILKENFNVNTITFILNSPMNGQLQVQVPYNDFIKSSKKIDYLWQKCAEQNEVQLIGNGYFQVHPKDPHFEEISNEYGF